MDTDASLSAASRIIRKRDIPNYSGLSMTATLRMVREGRFPRPIALTDSRRGLLGFLESEVLAWQRERLAEREAGEAAARRAAYTKAGRRKLGQAV